MVEEYGVVVVLFPPISRIILLSSPPPLSFSTHHSLLEDYHPPPSLWWVKKQSFLFKITREPREVDLCQGERYAKLLFLEQEKGLEHRD